MGSRTEALDCLIIGGGPAGLLAAIYFGRYRRHVQVIDAGESRAAKIPLSHNYPGFFGITGPELLARLRAQAEEYGVLMMGGRITSLRKEGKIFIASGPHIEMQANFVLLATGLVDHCPQVEGTPDCPTDASSILPDLRWLRSHRSASWCTWRSLHWREEGPLFANVHQACFNFRSWRSVGECRYAPGPRRGERDGSR